jgi:general secretion pathway protein D
MVEVGVKLYVTPTINDSDFVSLQIRPEVSSVTSFSDGIPIVEKTEAETEVLIRDGVTLIIGGLIKNENRKTVRKVPLLGDIPLLGRLFSSTDRQLVKSELIIFITPHIISGDAMQVRGTG